MMNHAAPGKKTDYRDQAVEAVRCVPHATTDQQSLQAGSTNSVGKHF